VVAKVEYSQFGIAAALITLPPLGEGAPIGADEGLITSPISENLAGDQALIRPSATFSQREKGDRRLIRRWVWHRLESIGASLRVFHHAGIGFFGGGIELHIAAPRLLGDEVPFQGFHSVLRHTRHANG
jgi:hypothetical protein